MIQKAKYKTGLNNKNGPMAQGQCERVLGQYNLWLFLLKNIMTEYCCFLKIKQVITFNKMQ